MRGPDPGTAGRRSPAGVGAVLLGVLILAGLGSGCATTSAPPEWLPRAEEAGSFPYGGWVTVESWEGKEKIKSHGELIAVTDSSVFVLRTGKDWNPGMGPGVLTEISTRDLEQIKLMSYRSNMAPVVGWATIGTVSTLSHGWGLILTAPLWMLVGTAASVTAADEPQTVFPKDAWDDLVKYARFPQGMPPGPGGVSAEP